MNQEALASGTKCNSIIRLLNKEKEVTYVPHQQLVVVLEQGDLVSNQKKEEQSNRFQENNKTTN